MLFNSLTFLAFFALFLPAYFVTTGRARMVVCLGASYLFYGWWDWRFLGLLAGSTLLDFLIGLLIGGSVSTRLRRGLLFTSLAANLGLLGYFKYSDFFIQSLNDSLAAIGIEPSIGLLRVILPVGISFYTFQTLSYSIDVYRGVLSPERSLIRFATFVSFFPQLVAGPIVRAETMLPQLVYDRRPEWSRVVSGANLILMGFLYKVVLADSLAPLVDDRFAQPGSHGWASLSVGVFFYAFQIYGDFCGYSAIAIGICQVLGFEIGRNFDRPYFSSSFSEFWRRWHISLSSWLRDYLYIPLGGNRGGLTRTSFNLTATMLIGGLWHGAAWNFVIWGGLHAAFLVLQRCLSAPWRALTGWLPMPAALVSLTLVVLTFGLTCLAWVFFRSQTAGQAMDILNRIFTLQGESSIPGMFWVAKGGVLVALVLIAEAVSFRVDLPVLLLRRPVINVAYAIVALLFLALCGTFDGHAFIYFQF